MHVHLAEIKLIFWLKVQTKQGEAVQQIEDNVVQQGEEAVEIPEWILLRPIRSRSQILISPKNGDDWLNSRCNQVRHIVLSSCFICLSFFWFIFVNKIFCNFYLNLWYCGISQSVNNSFTSSTIVFSSFIAFCSNLSFEPIITYLFKHKAMALYVVFCA